MRFVQYCMAWYLEKPAETAKERAAREAREKIRKREAEEAAQNLGSIIIHLTAFSLLISCCT